MLVCQTWAFAYKYSWGGWWGVCQGLRGKTKEHKQNQNKVQIPNDNLPICPTMTESTWNSVKSYRFLFNYFVIHRYKSNGVFTSI